MKMGIKQEVGVQYVRAPRGVFRVSRAKTYFRVDKKICIVEFLGFEKI